MHCHHCDREFEAQAAFQKFCSPRCRQAAWQGNREAKLREAVKRLVKVLGLTPEDFR